MNLPPDLRSKLSFVGRRTLIERILRFVTAISLALILSFLAFLAIDLAFGWSVRNLRIASLIILGSGQAVLLAGIGILVARRPNLRELANDVERNAGGFQERLVSLATLSGESGPLVEALAKETRLRTDAIDFRTLVSWHQSKRLARIAGAAALITGLTVFAWPPANRFTQRLLHLATPAAHGFEIVARPNAGFASLDQPILVEANLTAVASWATLPTEVWLTVDSPPDLVGDHAMTLSTDHQFSVALAKMPRELRFRVRAGEVETRTMIVTGAPPINLVSTPTVDIIPPPYAVMDPKEVSTEVPIDLPFRAVQYSRLEFSFHLDHPAVRARLTWKDADGERDIPLSIANEKIGAYVVAATPGPCSGSLILESEHGLMTRVPIMGGAVWTDAPPMFTRPLQIDGVEAGAAAKKIRPNDILRLEATVDDSVGISQVAVEFLVNDLPPTLQPVERGEGRRRVSGTWGVRLPTDIKSGDRVAVRLHAIDNRQLRAGAIAVNIPPADLLPQETASPSAEQPALHFVVDERADSLETQTIFAQRDDVAETLRGIRQAIASEAASLQKVIRGSHGVSFWTSEQAQNLAEVRKQNGRNQSELRGLATKLSSFRGMGPLARLSKDVADREMERADRKLEQAQPASLPGARREPMLTQAAEELQGALKRIDELLKVNEMLARDRVDQWELEKLAFEEEDLARRATQESGKEEPGKLQSLQKDIARRFEEWVTANPLLKGLAAAEQRQRAEKLAMEAKRLADMQRKRAVADRKELEAKWKDALAEIARKQAVLADKVGRLDRDLLLGLDSDAFPAPVTRAHKAADHLKEGSVDGGLVEQSKTIEDLNRLEARLAQAIFPGGDLRTAVQRLASLQGALLDEIDKLGNDFPRITIEETVKRLNDLHQKQKSLHQAIEMLPLTGASKEARTARQQASASADDATAQLKQKDLLTARAAMERARDFLGQLASRLPELMPNSSEKTTLRDKVRRQGETTAGDLAREQKALNEEAWRIALKILKSGGSGPGGESPAKMLDGLKDDLAKLSRNLEESDAKSLAAESAAAVDDARVAMKKQDEARDMGQFKEADKRSEEAALKMEMAGQKLQAAADKMSTPADGKDTELKGAFQEASNLMKKAAAAAPSPIAFDQVTRALKKTAQLAGNQMTNRFPQPGPLLPSARIDDTLPPAPPGAAWGDLPDDVRARLVQDLRARYGEHYEAIIQRYFKNLAEK